MIPKIWRLKGLMVRLTVPIFYRHVGRGTMFTGRIRWPMPGRKVFIGRNCIIGHDVFFQTGSDSKIIIGDNTSLNTGCHLVASSAITIGENVAVGEYVSIRDQEHLFMPSKGVRGQGYKVLPVIIEDNVWIGRGAYLGPGSHVRSGSIVAANAVVRGSYPANSLIAGVPATVRRTMLGDGSRHQPDVR